MIALVLALASLAGAASDGVVNVNTAEAEQLQLLPRVGPSISERIIEFREGNGPFESVEELRAVRGIGERTLELLRPYVAVDGDTTLTEKVSARRAAATE
jgi:competence protein ComEA